MFFLGIDIAKATFDVALLSEDGHPKCKVFANTPDGFAQLLRWLEQHLVRRDTLHACLESTGVYGNALAHFLYHQGCQTVSVVNPAATAALTAAFAKSQLARNKTDKTDAIRIARYAQALRPAAWTPPAPEIAYLQALSRRRDALLQMRTMESNRLETAPLGDPATAQPIAESIHTVIDLLDAQIASIEKQMHDHIDQTPSLRERRDLLDSIPGIAETTATALLAEMPDITAFADAPTLAAFVGLTPRQKESGSSIRGRSRLSKMGSARIRKALYWPAITAMRHNAAVKALRTRLLARGKDQRAIRGAAMRKLLHIVYGVLKSGKPFDASIALASGGSVA